MKELLKEIDSLTDKVEDWSRLHAAPLVSVYLVTYNHEKFIEQALDGILMQKVDFPSEIVIGEDKSTDRTREIVCEFQRRYPDKIRLHLSKENLYSQKMAGYGPLAACRGKYIALCEGDDYWADPKKLQKQVDFMESHLECSMCFHDRQMVDRAGVLIPDSGLPSGMKKSLNRSEILCWEYPVPPTATVMYRKCAIAILPPWLNKVFFGDRALAITATRHGLAGYVEDVRPSAHRIHEGGVYRGNASAIRDFLRIQFCRDVLEYEELNRADTCALIRRIHLIYCSTWRKRRSLTGAEIWAEMWRQLLFISRHPIHGLSLGIAMGKEWSRALIRTVWRMFEHLFHLMVVLMKWAFPEKVYVKIRNAYRKNAEHTPPNP